MCVRRDTNELFISLQPDFASSLFDGLMLEIVLRGIGDEDMFYSQPRKSVGIGQVKQASDLFHCL
jgi:hypothetical protein